MRSILEQLKFYFSYWIFWIGYFILSRFVFLILNFDKTKDIESFFEGFYIFLYGFKLDLSAAGYLMLIPTLILIINSFFKKNYVEKFIKNYTLIFLLIISFIVVMDASLFKHWGTKLDVYGTIYLQHSREVLNFIPLQEVLINAIAFILLFVVSYFIYTKTFHPQLQDRHPELKSIALTLFVLMGLSIIPIRGGIGLNPLNLSNVYFSNQTFPNNAAINVMWNTIYTYTERHKLHQTYQYILPHKVTPYFDSLHPTIHNNDSTFILKTKKTNLIFIILESFTSKLIDKKWNNIEITPHLNQLIKEGIYFENFYASGDRTDEGIISILSGFPAQPLSYIINYQNKTAKLPSLIRDFKQEGYHTSFYYGGDVNFANMKSYLLQSGMEKMIVKEDFPSNQYSAKWGVHDHFLFEKLLKDVQTSKPPFFKTLLSLSSHSPFDTPIEKVILGEDDNSLFANSANYTDSALGDFISQFKSSPQWKNTLVVIVADHGIKYIDNCSSANPAKYKIPMIWLGGALNENQKTISKYASQTDIANTLLQQFQMKSNNYIYSKNIFSPSSKSFSFYTFNHGFGFVSDSTEIIYNHTGKHFFEQKNTMFPDSIGNAYLQKVSNDFSEK